MDDFTNTIMYINVPFYSIMCIFKDYNNSDFLLSKIQEIPVCRQMVYLRSLSTSHLKVTLNLRVCQLKSTSHLL